MRRKWIPKVILLFVSTLLGLCIVEAASRIIYPISIGARNVTADGEELKGWLKPGTTYRQISSEFDAVTTITGRGHRVPDAEGNPDVVFLGDSFTFGWGLADEETFAARYCRFSGYSCVNLGTPGTGTAEQLEILDRALSKWQWRPKEVKLFIFAMSSSLMGGNDLADNFDFKHSKKNKFAEQPENAGSEWTEGDPSFLERMAAWRYAVLAHSNLIRIVKFHWGPMLRSLLSPGSDQARLDEALGLTGAALERLALMRGQYGFKTSIYLLHPIQDIIRGTHPDTLNELNAVSPIRIQGTAELFLHEPERFYYAYDGHLNERGSRSVAEFLIEQEEQ